MLTFYVGIDSLISTTIGLSYYSHVFLWSEGAINLQRWIDDQTNYTTLNDVGCVQMSRRSHARLASHEMKLSLLPLYLPAVGVLGLGSCPGFCLCLPSLRPIQWATIL